MGMCDEPDCSRQAEHGGKCWAHRKAMQRYGSTESCKEALLGAAIRYADCDTANDEAYRERERSLLDAARRYKHGRRA